MAEKIVRPEPISEAINLLEQLSFTSGECLIDQSEIAFLLKDIVGWWEDTHTKQAGVLGKENRKLCAHEGECMFFEADTP